MVLCVHKHFYTYKVEYKYVTFAFAPRIRTELRLLSLQATLYKFRNLNINRPSHASYQMCVF